jgi:hypothetical protein
MAETNEKKLTKSNRGKKRARRRATRTAWKKRS